MAIRTLRAPNRSASNPGPATSESGEERGPVVPRQRGGTRDDLPGPGDRSRVVIRSADPLEKALSVVRAIERLRPPGLVFPEACDVRLWLGMRAVSRLWADG